MSQIREFAESARGFTKSPLGIIALFIVLIYGFATIAVTFSGNLKEHIEPLIYFLIFFPVIVFIGFLWLVAKHSDKIYGPSDFKNEENFMRMKLSTVASLTAATVKPGSNNDQESIEKQLNSIVEVVTTTTKKGEKENSKIRNNRVLWVDDRPMNNVNERQAFEAQGVSFTLALSTDEAINILKDNKFAAIISDMGRAEGPAEGYVLLEKIRQMGDRTPFIIYAGSNLPEHKKMALEKGAQGSTNNAHELFKLVMDQVLYN